MILTRACIQAAVSECMTDNSTNTSTLDACQDPDDTQYISNIDITPPSDCSDFSASASGDIGDETYEVVCTYDTTTDDVTCSAPKRTGS